MDVIDNYSQGASGALAYCNGDTVTYTVTYGATTINRANHGNNSARIDGQGNETVEVTFSEPVIGSSFTFLNFGSVATHTVNDDGTISGGTNADGSNGQLIFNFPVTTVGGAVIRKL